METNEIAKASTQTAASQIPIRQIYPFWNHPFKVLDDDRMKGLFRVSRKMGF